MCADMARVALEALEHSCVVMERQRGRKWSRGSSGRPDEHASYAGPIAGQMKASYAGQIAGQMKEPIVPLTLTLTSPHARSLEELEATKYQRDTAAHTRAQAHAPTAAAAAPNRNTPTPHTHTHTPPPDSQLPHNSPTHSSSTRPPTPPLPIQTTVHEPTTLPTALPPQHAHARPRYQCPECQEEFEVCLCL